MEFGLGLYQEQSQKLVMTTQMKQAIELLQCTQQELDVLLAEAALENPLLEVVPPVGASEWSGGRSLTGSSRSRTDGESISWDQWTMSHPSRTDELTVQICELASDRRIARIAILLLGYLDESGYLRESVEELSSGLGCAVADVAAAVDLLQSCDPPGLAARDLCECLRMQIRLVPAHLQSIVLQVIDDGLDDVAARRLPQLAKRLKQPVERIQHAVDALRGLNPRPGVSIGYQQVQYVKPEVVVERLGCGYVVLSNDSALPLMRISPSYQRLLRTTEDETTQRFLMKKYHDVKWLLRCMEQRRLTLYRVADEIVRVQQRFFDEGPRGLRPLTLAQVADELGLHESTVSRATRGKYMQTPRGVFEMKFFFKAEVAGDDGAVSAEAAKHCIRACVEAEDARHPLSDEAVCQQLSAQGIHISRRTVAKYREELNIPSSSRRRRFA